VKEWEEKYLSAGELEKYLKSTGIPMDDNR